jgi:hypothetical protein
MEAITEIDVSMNNRVITITLPIKEQELIENIISALKDYVAKGSPVKVRQSYVTSLSDSLKVITKIMPSSSAVEEWRGEIRQLISMIQKGEKV